MTKRNANNNTAKKNYVDFTVMGYTVSALIIAMTLILISKNVMSVPLFITLTLAAISLPAAGRAYGISRTTDYNLKQLDQRLKQRKTYLYEEL